MPSITIDLTEQEHDHLVAVAEREGRSMDDVVKGRLLPDDGDMSELGDLLEERIRRLRREGGVEIAEGDLYGHLEARASLRER